MKIPKRVKVGPHVYKVVFEKKLSQNFGFAGQSRHMEGVIALDSNQSNSQQEDTLIHEILHAINTQIGFVDDDRDVEEKAVSRLAPLLLSVIKDNPKIFKNI